MLYLDVTKLCSGWYKPLGMGNEPNENKNKYNTIIMIIRLQYITVYAVYIFLIHYAVYKSIYTRILY